MAKRSFLLLCAMASIWGLGTSIGAAQEYGWHGRCSYLPGAWAWFVNGTAYFFPDGTTKQGTSSATWACARGTAVITWSTGYIDTVTISPNGLYLSGTNQEGGHITARRIGDL